MPFFRVILAVLAICIAASLLPAPALADGSFAVRCRVVKRAKDDPIVYPGQQGVAHSHDFYGTLTKANSTYDSMRAQQAVCSLAEDTAGYWHPTLYVDRVPQRASLTAYYLGRGLPSRIRPFPRGLRMVVGSASATRPQSYRSVVWRCEAKGFRSRNFGMPPTCSGVQHLVAYVLYPECWNGRTLDSPDHISHMAYRTVRGCARSHPVLVPKLVQRFAWPVQPRREQVTLSSGAAWTMHADFWNTWNQSLLNQLVTRCLRETRTCGLLVD